jgi:membrane protease YdiL (CAAX protease family)
MFSAVWFALRHSEYGMWNISHAFLIGVLYTGLTVITRTLWPAVLAHATYNTAVML